MTLAAFIGVVRDRLGRAAFALWAWLPQIASFVLLMVIALVVGLAIRDGRDDPVENVGKAWSDSIARLGIRPLFPPAEDFHVGDIYAVLRLHPAAARNGVKPDGLLTSRALRLHRLDMSEPMLERQRERPVLRALSLATDAGPPKAAAGPPASETAAPPTYGLGRQSTDAIVLNLLHFPGITISVSRAAGLGRLLDYVTGEAQRARGEEIAIENPLTYGIDAELALARLMQFCGSPMANNPRCDEDYLRFLLAAQFGRDICATSEGVPIYSVNLMVVNRVFVSRRIQLLQSELVGGRVAQGPASPAPDKPELPERSEAAGDRPGPRPAPAVAPPYGGLAFLSQSALRSGELLPRPVTFGFHAVALAAGKTAKTEFTCDGS